MSSHVLAGLLFDNDGVLVDSDDSALSAWARWAVEHDLDPDAVTAVVHGRRAEDTVAALLPEAARPDGVRRINALELETAEQTTALPGALDLLTGLGERAWAVVTSATQALARARLGAAGLPVPTVLVTADDVRAGKPAPDGYRLGAERLGVPTMRCAVFEDSPAGVLAGHAAGAGVVVGVNLRDPASKVWARVPDLRSVRVRSRDGAHELRVS